MVEKYKEELYTTEDPPHLIGFQCEECGSVEFPFGYRCSKCRSDKLAKKHFPPKGKIHSWAICQTSASEFFDVPYAIAYVDFPEEDVRVFGQLELENYKDPNIEIGQEVKTIEGDIRKNEENEQIQSFKFKPIKR